MDNRTVSWRVALIGECMIELQKLPTGEMQQTFGGDTLNTAMYLSRLGAARGVRVSYISALGDDAFSKRMRAFWSGENVDHSLTRSIPGKLPGLYCIETDSCGERSFSYWRNEAAARDTFEGEEGAALLSRLDAFDAVYCSGISLAVLRQTGRARLLDRLERLRASGVMTVFDCNYRPRLWHGDDAPEKTAYPWYKLAMAAADTVFISRDEVRVLGLEPGMPSREICDAALALGAREVVLKDGGNDCVVARTGKMVSVPASRPDAVVDTTAAGDSFAAGYMLARRLGEEPENAAIRAHRLAACVVGYRGAVIPQAAMPDIFADVYPDCCIPRQEA